MGGPDGADRRQGRAAGAAPDHGGSGGALAGVPASVLGDLIRRSRQEAGLAQEELAGLAGVSLRTVRNIERNRVARPRTGSVLRLLNVLGVAVPGDIGAFAGPAGGPVAAPDGAPTPDGALVAGGASAPDGAPADHGAPGWGGGAVPPGGADKVAGEARGRWPPRRGGSQQRLRSGTGHPAHGPPRLEPALAVGVLGPLAVHQGGVPVQLGSSRLRTLLGRLSIQHGQPVLREEIADALWGQSPPRTYLALVNSYIARLRDILEPHRPARRPAGVLASTAGGYRLDLDGEQLDLARFDLLVERGQRARAAGDLATARGLLEQALACWRGPLLADVDSGVARHPAAVAATQRRLDTAVAYADTSLDLGRCDPAVVATLQAFVVEEPLHEGLHARLMLALATTGRQAAALDLFTALRARLADELGIEPGAELTAAYLRVLRQEVPASSGGTVTVSGDGGAPAPPGGAAYAPSQIPAGVISFNGRAAYLRQMDDLLDGVRSGAGPGAGAAVCVIAGTAGVGKTTLAVHWARRVSDQFPDGQLYVNLQGFDRSGAPMRPADAIRGFLDAFGVPPERIPASLAAQAALYRSLLAGKRVLVLLDNARDTEQVRALLPGAAGCFTVVTSRNRLASLVADGASPITVELLPRDEAVELLARRLGAERLAAEPAAVDEIITRCSRLPLALAIVAARAAAHPGFPLVELARELAEVGGALDVLDTGDLAARAVFSWSYQALSPAAARLFRLLGLHPGPDVAIPAAASVTAVSVAKARQLLAELTRAHLITEHVPGRFACHDLLRAYAAERCQSGDPERKRAAATLRSHDHYLHTAYAAARVLNPARPAIRVAEPADGVTVVALDDYGQALRWFTAEHSVLLAIGCQAASLGHDRHVWQLAWCLFDYFCRQGHWHDWAASHEAALVSARRLGSRQGQAHAHRGLGQACSYLRRDAAAVQHLCQALDLSRDLDDRRDEAAIHHDLARVFERQGRHADAVQQAWQALELYRSVDDLAGQARVHNGIGWHYALLGEYHTALRHCEQAQDLLEQIGDRTVLAATRDSLGYINYHLGHYDRAKEYYALSLAGFRELGDRAFEGEVLLHLGDAHLAAEEPAQARDAWRSALAILEELGVPEVDQARARLATR